MVLKKGTYGNFYACRNYPECKGTRPCIKDTGVACPLCGKRINSKAEQKQKDLLFLRGLSQLQSFGMGYPSENSVSGVRQPCAQKEKQGYKLLQQRKMRME